MDKSHRRCKQVTKVLESPPDISQVPWCCPINTLLHLHLSTLCCKWKENFSTLIYWKNWTFWTKILNIEFEKILRRVFLVSTIVCAIMWTKRFCCKQRLVFKQVPQNITKTMWAIKSNIQPRKGNNDLTIQWTFSMTWWATSRWGGYQPLPHIFLYRFYRKKCIFAM